MLDETQQDGKSTMQLRFILTFTYAGSRFKYKTVFLFCFSLTSRVIRKKKHTLCNYGWGSHTGFRKGFTLFPIGIGDRLEKQTK